LYVGIHCIAGLAFIMVGVFFMGKFIRWESLKVEE
jgi:hypothetical protein